MSTSLNGRKYLAVPAKEMIMRILALVLLNLIFWALPIHAQLWSGIVDPSRATNWSSAGATITHRTTQCGSTIAAYNGSATTITNAIAACGTNQYVQLGTGTFNLSSGVDFAGKNNVTLRGNGPNNTRLVFTAGDGCNGLGGAVICIRTTSNWNVGSAPHSATVSGSFTAGSTSLTFSSVSGLAVGDIVVLDQLNDSTTDTGEVWVDATTVSSSEGGCSHCRGGNRGTQQVVVVTNIAGSVVSFTPGLHASYWTAAKSPGAIWGDGEIVGVGVEELAVDVTGAQSNGFSFFGARNSWLRAVESYKANRAHILLFESTGITVRDSYFDEDLRPGGGFPQSYGLENYISSDCLIENNIWHHVTAPISVNGSASGCVYSYNYSLNNTFFAGNGSGFAWMHEAGIDTVLFEGNDMPAWFSDAIHGTHHFVTLFRNYSRGWESGLTIQTWPIAVDLGGRFYNVVGNVLGTNTYHTTYQALTDTSIYKLGKSVTARPNDSLVASTMLRWGNYDTVNDASRFLSSEVPSGLAKYANPLPGSQTLPNSFYLSAKPSWFGSVAWPPFGPDVTGGNQDTAAVGGHANAIPARLCYQNTAKDGSGRLTAFNPDTCYGTSGGGGGSADTVPPMPPQNLKIL